MTLPDGPQTPQFLQLLQWISQPVQYLETSVKAYGDCFTARWGGFPPYVLISNPQGIQELLTADPRQFNSGSGNKILQPLLGDQSLILLDGDRHQRQRQLLTPPFHGERMRAYGKLICDITEEVMNRLTIGKPFLIRATTQEISLETILGAVFGINEGQRFQELKGLLTSMLDAVSSPLSSTVLFFPSLQRDLGSWSPWGKFLRRRQQIDRLIYDEIQQRREQFDPDRTDILTLLMSARDTDGQPMTDEELRDELMTFLLAGHETTASAIAWALYWIHQQPEVQDKLLKELDSVGDVSDVSAISKLPYLNAVCSETLRIYPVALFTFGRIARSPVQLMGYQFDAGTPLAACIYLVHHREDIYPQANSFKPERFLERQFSPYEYLPFGGSNRRCIGMAFALFEMKLVLAKMLSRYQLALTDQRPVKPVRRGVTLAPPATMQMLITSQRPQNTQIHQPLSTSA
ncbi:cytochrome P450 [Trichocoleus sp. DQ-A3]|uniref:cytochrome P450 n=1 Tax=Cyanophyceae TaxID=3028117 RepID=UPI001684FC33|nr:cytochrome P450 [Coleofasciculus sp. FACHB-125]MBD1900003.1 cytochrome P450 [Coleofasciculus sp. FACHB-125]